MAAPAKSLKAVDKTSKLHMKQYRQRTIVNPLATLTNILSSLDSMIVGEKLRQTHFYVHFYKLIINIRLSKAKAWITKCGVLKKTLRNTEPLKILIRCHTHRRAARTVVRGCAVALGTFFA